MVLMQPALFAQKKILSAPKRRIYTLHYIKNRDQFSGVARPLYFLSTKSLLQQFSRKFTTLLCNKLVEKTTRDVVETATVLHSIEEFFKNWKFLLIKITLESITFKLAFLEQKKADKKRLINALNIDKMLHEHND